MPLKKGEVLIPDRDNAMSMQGYKIPASDAA